MPLDHSDPKPLYLQVAEHLQRSISEGGLHPGDQLGSHQKLAEEYSVSLITIKRALNDLVKEGVL